MKNTTEKAKIIYESKSTICLNIPPLLFTSYFIYINTKMIYNFDYFIYFMFFVASWVCWYFFYYQKKILLTEHKVYITRGKKKLHSISLAKDIDMVSYEQKGLGTRFGYGHLKIIKKDGVEVGYYFLSKPRVTYEHIVYAMETKFIKINPEFQRTIHLNNMTDTITEKDIFEAEEGSSGIDRM